MTDETQEPNDNEDASEPTAENVAFTEATTEFSGDELENLKIENAELKDRLLRSHAELENFRRRTQKESLDAMKYQSMPVIRDMLPGIDNLQRAIDAADQTGDTQNLIDGIKMVTQQFTDALKKHSAEPIDPVGEPFDPNLHEALTQIPSADHPPMTVIQVIEAGYKIHDRVLRPAKVMVSCAPPEAESSETAG